MKNISRILAVVVFMFICCSCSKGSGVDSVWKYEAAEFPEMNFTLYKNGSFEFKTTIEGKPFVKKGRWSFNKDRTILALTMDVNKYWNEIIFDNPSFQTDFGQYIASYDRSKRTVGYKITKSGSSKEPSFNYLGFEFYEIGR